MASTSHHIHKSSPVDFWYKWENLKNYYKITKKSILILERHRFLKRNVKENINNLDLIEIKNYCSSEDITLRVERKYFQLTYLTKDLYPEYMKIYKKRKDNPNF